MWLALHHAHWVADTCTASWYFRKNLSKFLKTWNKKTNSKLAKWKLIQKTERFPSTLEYFDFWIQTKKYVEKAILSKLIKVVFFFLYRWVLVITNSGSSQFLSMLFVFAQILKTLSPQKCNSEVPSERQIPVNLKPQESQVMSAGPGSDELLPCCWLCQSLGTDSTHTVTDWKRFQKAVDGYSRSSPQHHLSPAF